MQRLHLSSYHHGEQVSVRRIILVRTSQLRLCLRKSTSGKARECWLQQLLAQKREASAALARNSHSCRESSMSGSSHIPSDVFTQTEIEPRPDTFAGVSCRERLLAEHQ